MNPKQISKLYGAMNLDRRAALASDALMRGDSDTYRQIAFTVPRLTYKQRDIRFSQKVSNRCDLVLAWTCEHWRTLAIYLMNQKLLAEVLKSENKSEQKELQKLTNESLSKLVALEVVIKALASDLNLDISNLFESELLVSFFNAKSPDCLSTEERKYYDEYYNIFAPVKSNDQKPIDSGFDET